jgi:hypothetical protein
MTSSKSNRDSPLEELLDLVSCKSVRSKIVPVKLAPSRIASQMGALKIRPD